MFPGLKRRRLGDRPWRRANMVPPVSRPWVHGVTALKALVSGCGVNELRLSAQLPSDGSQPKVMLPGLSKKTL